MKINNISITSKNINEVVTLYGWVNKKRDLGGLIFIVPSLILYFILYFLGKVSLNYNTIIVILTFICYGMIGFIDPIRKEVVASISECRSAGIKVLMITGDHPLTAFSIAKDLKLTKVF